VALLGLAAALLLPARAGKSLGAPVEPNRYVLVISVDGMGASWYAAPPAGVSTPNLTRLKTEGSFAEAVEGVYPTVTYPSHTTLVTGRMPAEHGVYSNLSSRIAGENPRDWYWFAKIIKVPTLWDEARKAHLSTASVFWPVSAGADIDWDIPEIWDPKKGAAPDPLYIARFATPGLLLEATMAIGAPSPSEDRDTTIAKLAGFILKKHKPNLMLIHLELLDDVEHGHGPESAEARAMIERMDARIGEILAADRDAGLAGSTDVFIVSDHGFLPVERVIQPNVLLAKAGFFTLDSQGHIASGKIQTVSNGGSFFIYWPEGEDLRVKIRAALRPLFDQGLAWAVFDHQAVLDLGAEPAIQMALDAPLGAEFDSSAVGDLVVPTKEPHGAHGFLPFRKGLESSFIAWGPDIRSGVNLHRIRITTIGPTILKVMGVDDPSFGDQPPLVDIEK
jgi:predicted AlkP superfamily pyrophosphatase or phosphodiesterase